MSVTAERKKAAFSPSNSQTSTALSSPTRAALALADLVRDLRALGVRDPAELLRRGTVAMGRRAVAAMPGHTVRWLEAVLADGASMLRADPVVELDRRRVEAFDALWLERTGREWGASA